MVSQDEQVSIAVAALCELERVHNLFVKNVASMPNTTVNGGSFASDGTSFSATALGIPFRVVRRPVTVNGYLMASEYAFITEHNGNDLCLWRVYLNGSGVLFTDAALSNSLCDFTNNYVPSKVVVALASALMTSPVFAPGRES